MLQFPYQAEPLGGSAPPSLPTAATYRWRPLVPVTILGPTGTHRFFPRAVLDPGADDTVFPLAFAPFLAVTLLADSSHGLRWRGQFHAMRFGHVELELSDGAQVIAGLPLSHSRRRPFAIRSSDLLGASSSLTHASVAKIESSNWKPIVHTREPSSNARISSIIQLAFPRPFVTINPSNETSLPSGPGRATSAVPHSFSFQKVSLHEPETS
jgi:hypothetical protein